MTCRHEPGDPNCSSSPNYRRLYESAPATPDAASYSIEEVERMGANLVMKVKYPNCARCAYEGVKVLVFLNVTEAQVLKWRKIDPHFRADKAAPHEAPSPAARFPASAEGWQDALGYARGRARGSV
jgi:hypothetical protein